MDVEVDAVDEADKGSLDVAEVLAVASDPLSVNEPESDAAEPVTVVVLVVVEESDVVVGVKVAV